MRLFRVTLLFKNWPEKGYEFDYGSRHFENNLVTWLHMQNQMNESQTEGAVACE